MSEPPTPLLRRLEPLLLALGGLLLGVLLAAATVGFEVSSLARELPGFDNDDYRHAVYLHDQVHRALLDGRLTLDDPDQLVPVGDHPVGRAGGNVLEMLLSGAFRLVAPWPLWLSLGALAWIPLNLLAFLPLGRRLWPGRPEVVLSAAAAWALYPPLLGQIAAGRLTQVALLGLPLAVLGLLQLVERGGGRAVLLCAAGVALTGLGYWYYAVFLAFTAPVFWAWGAWSRGGGRAALRPVLLDLLRAAGASLLLVLPVLLVVLYERYGHGAGYGKPLSAEHASPDFADALRLSGEQARHVRGWLPPVLLGGAVLSLWRGRRRPLWLGALGVCLLFALGPGQHLGAHLWLLPSWPVWRFWPGMDAMNHPERWLAVGGVFLVLLAAEGLARLPRPASLLALLLPLGVLHEGHRAGQLPLGGWQLQVPAVWQDLAESEPATGTRGAVVVLPIGRSQGTCAFQPFVGRPLLGGMVENQPWFLPPQWVEFVQQSPLLTSLWALGTGRDHSPVLYQADLDQLRGAGFDTVLLDQDKWSAVVEAQRVPVRQRLEALLGPAEHQDDSGAWWRLPETGGQPGPLPEPAYAFQLNGPPGEDPKGRQGAHPEPPRDSAGTRPGPGDAGPLDPPPRRPAGDLPR